MRLSPSLEICEVLSIRAQANVISTFSLKLCSYSIIHSLFRYPRGFEVMRHALHDHCNDPEIVSAILKFVSSLA